MKSLRTLGFVAGGAIVLSMTYALALKDHSSRLDYDRDAERSVRHVVNGDRGEFSSRNEQETLEAEWRGKFGLTDNGNGIRSVDRYLRIKREMDDETQRVVFEDTRDGLRVSYYVDDEEQPADEIDDSAVNALVLQFLRASGIQSDERVSALLKSGGTNAALDELSFLNGDHALQRYTVALTEQADLSSSQIIELADKLKAIEGDHSLRLALRSILENETLSADATPALIETASKVESNHDLRLLVEAFAERPLNADAMDLALGLFERIESNHDLRVGAEALLDNPALSTSQTARLLKTSATAIDSNHDMRLVLTKTAPLFSASPEVTDAWLEGFATLSSEHEQRLSIEAAADNSHAPDAWMALIEASETIDSERETRLALEAIAEHLGGEAALLAAYRKAADSIDSERERQLALEALEQASNE